MTRKLLLHDVHAAAGASFEERDGLLLPVRYGPPEKEYAAARAGAVVDAGFLSLLVFSGRDRKDFLQGLLTGDVAALVPGAGHHACLLTHKGKLVADFWLFERSADLFSLQWPAAAAAVRESLKKYLPLSETAVEEGAGLGAFLLVGAGAKDAAKAAARCFCAPCGFAAADGWLAVFPAEDGARVWKDLTAAGLAPAGFDVLETLRLENGRPRMGRDYEGEIYPAEIGLDAAISYTKGCYLGQETTMRLKTQGKPQHRLVGLKLSAPASPGDAVSLAGETVGRVTSAGFSPRLGSPLALAFVRRTEAASFVLPAGPAEIVDLPLA